MREQITFKLVYRFENQMGRVIDFCRQDKHSGLYQYLTKKGQVVETSDFTDNDAKRVMKWALAQSENIEGTKRTRCFIEKSYYTKEGEELIKDQDDQANNRAIRLGHEFLKRHPDVIVKNGTNENTNKFVGANPLFELIEEGMLERKSVEANLKKTEGRKIITELFEKSKDQFIEFCYAYNLQVKGSTLESLYNKAMLKLENNPYEWEETLKNSNYDLLSKFRKACEEGIVEFTNGYYQFNSETIGKDEKECLSYFNLNESPRNLLYSKVGYATPTVKSSIVEPKPISKNTPDKVQEKSLNMKIVAANRILDEDQKKEKFEEIKKENPDFIEFIEKRIAEIAR